MVTTPLSEHLLKGLMSFGLSGNEAKTYLALVQLRQATARAVARLANLPRQEIYRVMPRLERLGIVEVIVSKPTRFLAVPPEDALSELIDRQTEIFAQKVSELQKNKKTLENELKKVEGKSAGIALPKPVHYALISGRHQVNEKIQEMLRKAKTEVLWMSPKYEIIHAVLHDRDKILRQCAEKHVKVRVLTEVDEKNVKELKNLSSFCEMRHAPDVTTLITIVDDNELIVGSAVHKSPSLTGTELIHELWTDDYGHIKIMKDFFEKVWSDSMPAELEIKSMKRRKNR